MVRSSGKSGPGTTCGPPRGAPRRERARRACRSCSRSTWAARRRSPASPRRRRRACTRRRSACPHLDVRGLMAVPPYDPDPEKSRPYFRRLAGAARPARRAVRSPAAGALDGHEPRLRRRRRGGLDRGADRHRPLRPPGGRVNVGGSAAGAIVDVILCAPARVCSGSSSSPR